MKYLIYENNLKKEIVCVGIFETIDEVFENIDNFNERTKFRSLYTRIIEHNGYRQIDFGSYYRFYYIFEDEELAYKKIAEVREYFSQDEADIVDFVEYEKERIDFLKSGGLIFPKNNPRGYKDLNRFEKDEIVGYMENLFEISQEIVEGDTPEEKYGLEALDKASLKRTK